jgi:phosphoglycolate phosphatase
MKYNGGPKRCYFFDVDGTLVDSLPGIEFSIRAALRSLGKECNGEIRQLIGPPIREVLQKIIGDESELELDRVEAQFRKYYDSEGWKRANLYPGVEATLKELKEQGNRLFVFTNKPAHVTTAILKGLKVSWCFEAILSRDSRVPHFEDKGAMLSELMRDFDVSRESGLVTGDSGEDFRAASATGIPFCFVTYGYGSLPEGQSSAYVWQIDSFSKLLSISR